MLGLAKLIKPISKNIKPMPNVANAIIVLIKSSLVKGRYKYEKINDPTITRRPKIVKKIALNGTVQGIDDTLGIPASLWQATIDSLTEQTYLKFVRRMCSDTSLYEEYLQNKPQRALESFKSELISLQAIAKQRKQNNFEYDLAIVGNKDKIIAPKNQLLSWSNAHVLVKQTEIAHYSLETFKALVAHEY